MPLRGGGGPKKVGNIVREAATLSGKRRRCQGSGDVVREAATLSRGCRQRGNA